MEIVEIGGYAVAITSILALLGVISKLYFVFKKAEEHQRENYLMILKLVIMSDSMPLSERIDAGDKYTSLGGNGKVKVTYNELVDKYRKDENLGTKH